MTICLIPLVTVVARFAPDTRNTRSRRGAPRHGLAEVG